MASMPRRWPTPEECLAAMRLDAMGAAVLGVAIGVSGLMIGLMLRAISG